MKLREFPDWRNEIFFFEILGCEKESSSLTRRLVFVCDCYTWIEHLSNDLNASGKFQSHSSSIES